MSTSAAADDLGFLQRWYSTNCDGDWEHYAGIEIGTLDNPGWRLQIDLVNTRLEGTVIERAVSEESDGRWLQFWADGKRFHAACGPGDLDRALSQFRALVEREGAAKR